MDRISVTSTSISEIGYDAAKQELEILFLVGGLYQYHGVPLSVYAKLIASDSIGQAFNTMIKNVYRTTKSKT